MMLANPVAAEKDAERATELDSRSSQAQLTLGFVHLRGGQFEQALEDFDRAVACDSENVWAVVWHASSQAQLARYELARLELRSAVRQFPGAYQTYMIQSWFLATCPNWIYRDGTAAIGAAKKAVALSDGDAYALDILAAANAEAGEFASACAAESRALDRLTTGEVDRAAMEARLRLYQEKTPYRDQR